MDSDRLVLLTAEGGSGRIAANYLSRQFPALIVIVERPVSRAELLRRRLRRLGWLTIAGQLAFMVFARAQARLSRRRIAEIQRQAGLDERLPAAVPVIQVASVNAPDCVAQLTVLKPAAVLVVGTRIIEPAVLRAAGVPFINYHAGVTPKYRGVHGGYWALAQGDGENCGVTVHLIDEGIDTGGVLYQTRIAPAAADNFSTYPYLQLAAALPLLAQAARDAVAGKLQVRPVDLPSRLWSHPTIWAYLATAVRRGVW
jgi:methionyl-tRNA formyltransferase